VCCCSELSEAASSSNIGVRIGLTSASSALIQPLLHLPHTDFVIRAVLFRTTSEPLPRFKRNAPRSLRASIHCGQTCSLLPAGLSQKMELAIGPNNNPVRSDHIRCSVTASEIVIALPNQRRREKTIRLLGEQGERDVLGDQDGRAEQAWRAEVVLLDVQVWRNLKPDLLNSKQLVFLNDPGKFDRPAPANFPFLTTKRVHYLGMQPNPYLC
jgi:hypothetical protein